LTHLASEDVRLVDHRVGDEESVCVGEERTGDLSVEMRVPVVLRVERIEDGERWRVDVGKFDAVPLDRPGLGLDQRDCAFEEFLSGIDLVAFRNGGYEEREGYCTKIYIGIDRKTGEEYAPPLTTDVCIPGSSFIPDSSFLPDWSVVEDSSFIPEPPICPDSSLTSAERTSNLTISGWPVSSSSADANSAAATLPLRCSSRPFSAAKKSTMENTQVPGNSTAYQNSVSGSASTRVRAPYKKKSGSN
jgi:hypothetical protein